MRENLGDGIFAHPIAMARSRLFSRYCSGFRSRTPESRNGRTSCRSRGVGGVLARPDTGCVTSRARGLRPLYGPMWSPRRLIAPDAGNGHAVASFQRCRWFISRGKQVPGLALETAGNSAGSIQGRQWGSCYESCWSRSGRGV